MVFRIRYRKHADREESEVVVEASNPAEALIKFRHACGPAGGGPAHSVSCVDSTPPDTSACL